MSAVTTFSVGQSVFSRDGQKHYVREILAEGRVLASPFLSFEDYDGSQEYPSETANIKLAGEMFPVAPTEVINADVVAARADLAAVKESIALAKRSLAEQERETSARLEKFKELAPLRLVEDYIDGKVTHFAVKASYGSKVEVVTFEKFLTVTDEQGRCRNEMKLLSLFGDAKGNLEWRRNEYRDGSGGGWLKCVPCLSEEQAKAEASDMLDAIWAVFRADQRQPWVLADSIASAEVIGVSVPEDIRTAVRESAIRSAESCVEKARVELEKREQALAKATGAA